MPNATWRALATALALLAGLADAQREAGRPGPMPDDWRRLIDSEVRNEQPAWWATQPQGTQPAVPTQPTAATESEWTQVLPPPADASQRPALPPVPTQPPPTMENAETFRYILMLASRYSAFATDDSAARLLPIVRHTALLYSDGGRDVAELRNVTLMSNIMVAAKATLAKLDGTEMRRVLVAMRPLLVPSTRSATLSTEGGVAELPTIPTELALQMERGYEAVVTLNDSMGLDSIVVMLSAIRIIAPVLNREDYKRFWASMRPFLLDLGEPGGAGAQALAQNIVQLQTSTPPGSPELTELFAPGVLGLAAATNFSLMSGALIAPFAAPFFEGTGASLGAGEFDVMLDLTRKVMSSTSPEEITALVAAVQRRADSLNAGADVQELQILNMMTVAQLLAQDHDPELFAVVMSDVFTPLVSGLIGSGGDAELLEAASLMQGMLEAVTDLYGGPYADVVSPETMELLLLLLHAVALDLDVLQTEDLDAIRAHVLGTTGALNGALLEATLCLRG